MTIEPKVASCNEMFLKRGLKAYKDIEDACKDPKKISTELIMKILDDNKDTEYGRKNDFANIKSPEEYRKKVPFSVFDDYAEYVVRELKGEKNLHCAYGTRQYNKSSGSMGNPKKIPMSSIAMDYMIAYANDHKYGLIANKIGDGFKNGKTLSVVEASSIADLNGKIYCGVSAQIVLEVNKKYSEIFTSPVEAAVPNPETNARYLHARYGLAEKNVSNIHTTFMTFILDLFHYIENNWELLCNDIEKGTIDPSIRMPDDVRSKLESELKPMPERAKELRDIFGNGFNNTIAKKIWPDISFISGVSTGTFSAYLGHIKQHYADNIPVYMIGIAASEGVFSVPFELDSPKFIPVATNMFLEFLPLDEEDSSKTKFLEELEEGKDYEIITTTLSGLYRYRTRDAVHVSGFHGKMPVIEYLYRIDLCINLNGEKTYEPALRKTVDDTAKEMGFSYTDFCVYPNTDAVPSCYSFYIEMTKIPEGLTLTELSKHLQENLKKANPMMVYKFERNLCGPVEAFVLQEETYLLYRDKMILKGGASTQVKPVKIISNEAQLRFFNILRNDEIKE